MSSDHTPKNTKRTDKAANISDDAVLETLFKHAGPRQSAPSSVKAEVFATVDQVWKHKVESRRRRRRNWALAASLLAAAGLGSVVWWNSDLEPRQTPPVETESIASLEAWFSQGTVPPIETGSLLAAGTEVSTVEGERAAIRLHTGVSLRLGPSTRARLIESDQIELITGVVYVDSGPSPVMGPENQPITRTVDPKIEIRTHLGHATNIGTQFELRLNSEQLRVQVREGIVRLAVDDRTHDAEAGTGVSVNVEGEVSRHVLPGSQDWSWAIDTAPPFQLEGSTLAQVLRWVSRETGWTLRFEDKALEKEAQTIVTHGSLDGLTPAQAPELVVPSAGLAYSLDQDTLLIHRP